MKKQLKWIPVSAALGAALSLSATSARAQDTEGLFAEAPALEGREVIWSGRVDGGLAARVERIDVDHVAVIIQDVERVVPLRGVRVGACVDASRTSTLMLTGKHGEASEAVRITREEVVTITLPAHAASAPHALTSSGACHWGIALADGTLVAIDAEDTLQQSAMLFDRIADLTEVGRGIPLVGIGGEAPIFVVSRAGRTSAWRVADAAVETVSLDALGPMIASEASAWSVDRAGALKAYTPFVGVREMASSQGAATTGLLATQLDGHDVLAWATVGGSVITWDGQRTALRAHWDTEIRQPLLAVDVHGDASFGLLATLENGSVGLVHGELATPIELGARSARAPMWVMTGSEAPACLAMTSAAGTRCFSLRELGPMGALGNGVTPMPGEVITEGSSVPLRTAFEPLWAEAVLPTLDAPGVAASPPDPMPSPASSPVPEGPSSTCSASPGASRGALGGGFALAALLVARASRRRRR
jgi:hypothetical protein